MPLQTDLDRVPLGHGPTPVRELTGLGKNRGEAPVWIKDDGAYSRVGGNKARKLEWLLADARRRGKSTILTGGATGTNHGLATAVFARRLGMRTVLVLAPQPETDHVRAQLARLRASGAEIHIAPGFYTSFLLAAWLTVAKAGPGLRTPYLVPPGGSTPLGCVGYVARGPGAPRPGHRGRAAGAVPHRRGPGEWRHRRGPPRRHPPQRAEVAPALRRRERRDPARGPQRRAPGPTDAPPPRRARRRRARGPGSRHARGSSGAGSAQATAVRPRSRSRRWSSSSASE